MKWVTLNIATVHYSNRKFWVLLFLGIFFDSLSPQKHSFKKQIPSYRHVYWCYFILTFATWSNSQTLEVYQCRVKKTDTASVHVYLFFKGSESHILILHGTVKVIRPPAGNNTAKALSLQWECVNREPQFAP